MSEPGSPLPEHVESTVQAIAAMHAEHEASASPAERLADNVTARLGNPMSVGILLGLVAAWIGINLCLKAMHSPAFDAPPFEWLDLLLSFAAAFMTMVILASQHRAEVLSGRRQQLMLQLAFLSDHKQAKIIALLEELRRDDPLIRDRDDHQAVAMTQTSNPSDVLHAIKVTHEELVSEAGARKEDVARKK
jgi:uncharacterized membrane protein